MGRALAYCRFLSTQVYTGAVPFSDIISVAAMLAITTNKRPPRPRHPTFTEDLWKLTQRCWDQDLSLRPKIPEVLQVLALSHTFAADERVSLVATIFSDDDQVKMIGDLSEDNAQTFIDAIYEASPCTVPCSNDRFIDFDLGPSILLIRRWIAFRRRPAGGVNVTYTGFVATTL